MAAAVAELIVGGDLVLDEPDGDYWLSAIAPALHTADLAIGHIEVPHSDTRSERTGDVPAPGAPPANLGAIARAGFDMASLAGNHIADCGPEGISDTIAGLTTHGVASCGAGPDLAAARRPALREVNGLRIALLSYNCVGPQFAWADEETAGCAYLPLETEDGQAVTPRSAIAGIAPRAFEILEEDIAKARRDADIVLVAMHKGRVHTPAVLEAYERPLAHAAIDAGAAAVLGHHAHILRGIEFHHGRPIFHGLGNCCVVTRALSPAQNHPARRQWTEQRQALFGFTPDPDYALAPFHPEAKLAMLGRLTLLEDGRVDAGIIPVFVEPPGRPVLAEGAKAAEIRRYVEDITRSAGLDPIAIDDAGHVRQVA